MSATCCIIDLRKCPYLTNLIGTLQQPLQNPGPKYYKREKLTNKQTTLRESNLYLHYKVKMFIQPEKKKRKTSTSVHI